MKSRTTVCLAVLALSLILTSSALGQNQNPSQSRIAGFLSATAGGFALTFPDIGPAGASVGEDVGFDDIYGSKNGLSYGGEAGLGLGDIGLFAVVRYRTWKKTGHPAMIGEASFDGDIEWSQSFLSFGVRYFLVKQTQTQRAFLPFFGGGMINSKATESVSGEVTFLGETFAWIEEMDIDGTGFYIEGGADLYVSPNISLRGMLEYSKLNLGISEQGVRAEIEGGGGLFAGVSINVFFGKPMKNP